MKTSHGQLLCEQLPSHVKMGIVFFLDGKEVQPKSSGKNPGADYNYTFTIGQMIQHTARCNVPILAVQWVVSGGGPVANYTVSAAAGVVYSLTPEMLNTNPLTFAYSVPAPVVVGVYIYTPYGIGYASASILLTAPQVNLFEAATEQVYVGPFQGHDWIRFGNPTNVDAPGITINVVAYGAQNFPGTLGILQLATNMRFASDAQHLSFHYNLNGQAVLDVGPSSAYIFYQNASAVVTPGSKAQFDITDAPGSPLVPPFTFVSIGDGQPIVPESYRSFLMFCPNTPGSIYVPLAVLTWNWAGYTELENSNWGPVQDPENLPNPVGVPTSTFPTWTNNTSTGTWVKGAGDNVGIRRVLLAKEGTA